MAVGDFGPNDTTLPSSGRWGTGPASAMYTVLPRYRQPGRDDVVERDQLGDLAVERDPQHPVVVPIGDQEPAAEGFQRVLDSGRDVERRVRRIAQGERADVRDDGEAVRAVHPVDADDVAAADVGADEGDQYVRGVADERDVDRPAEADDRPRQTAGERRDVPRLRIDARDPAGRAFGDVQRATGADGAARASLQAREQLGGVGGRGWRRSARCERRIDFSDAIRAAANTNQLSLGTQSESVCSGSSVLPPCTFPTADCGLHGSNGSLLRRYGPTS